MSMNSSTEVYHDFVGLLCVWVMLKDCLDRAFRAMTGITILNYEIQASSSCMNCKLGFVVNTPVDASFLQPLTYT